MVSLQDFARSHGAGAGSTTIEAHHEWRRIAAMAAGFGVSMYPHWFHDLHVHLVAATPNARFVEYFPDDQVLNFRRLVDTQLVFEDGNLVVPTGPGLGFRFDEQAVEKYAVDNWS